MKSLQTPLKPEFSFAGFTWPRYYATLPSGSLAKRLQRAREPLTGGYYGAPKPNDSGTGFYLNDDFAFTLRWTWADEAEGAIIRHTGWFADEFNDTTIRGVVFRLPHGRGFLAG